MPHTDPEAARHLTLTYLGELPPWPQLPNRSFLESMYVQFSQGFPGVVLEEDRIYVDRSRDFEDPLARLYQAYIEADVEAFAVGREYAAGLYSFLSLGQGSFPAVKGQVTGPVSWGLAVADQDRRPVLYNDTLADALARFLRLKAAWQEARLRTIASQTVVFLDEPYLSALGSAFVSIPSERVTSLLEETLGGIQGLKGIHCCGNTDWSLPLGTSIDILSFDAYCYGETVALYPEAVRAFLERGGVLAWGIVPNEEEALAREGRDSLLERLEAGMAALARKGVKAEALASQSLITPSCGLVGLSLEGAERALALTRKVSLAFRRRRGQAA